MEHKSRIWASVKDRPIPDENALIDVKLDNGSILIGCVLSSANRATILMFRGASLCFDEVIWWRYAN
jgi:hypothetical protein